MSSNVRNYSDKELLDYVKSLHSYIVIPKEYWITGVRSKENAENQMDDKFYLWYNEISLGSITGTTNSGSYGIQHFKEWDKRGYGEIKANEWYYNVWKLGKHKMRMDALIQVGPFKIIRKKSYNDPTKLWSWEVNKGFNFHCNSYDPFSTVVSWIIGGWSVGCQVANDRVKYFNKWIPLFKRSKQKHFTYVIIDEF